MNLCKQLLSGQAALSVIGLGYVGLPLALSFGRHCRVIGYDHNVQKVKQLCQGKDISGAADPQLLKNSSVTFTHHARDLGSALFHIIAVPTPVQSNHQPDLSFLKNATCAVGRHLVPGAYVVYESTVYPGATETVCIPLLEQTSGLVCGKDFFVGYSPERINPGDPIHQLENVTKVVSGCTPEALDQVSQVYRLVVQAGIHCAPSIAVAEAAKLLENTQRDINIAFLNEAAMLLHHLHLNTDEVLAAASTKWNFLPFSPGLVGGHCIGVDPYYLSYCGQQAGYSPNFILAGRCVNNSVAPYIAQCVAQAFSQKKRSIGKDRVAILGATFKENCPDVRNSQAAALALLLQKQGGQVLLYDPVADAEAFVQQYPTLSLCQKKDLAGLDAIIFAVPHREFTCITPQQVAAWYRSPTDHNKPLFDVRRVLPYSLWQQEGFALWQL